MKKMLIAALGLSGLLASCSNVTVTIPDFAPGYGSSTNLRLNAVSYPTNYRAATDYTDQNGNKIAAGTYFICDNLNTTMTITTEWSGTAKDLYVQLKGLRTGDEVTNLYSSMSVGDSSGKATVDFNIKPGMAPQSIVVNPKIITVKGNTYVRVQGVDPSGARSNIFEGVQALPIVTCG